MLIEHVVANARAPTAPNASTTYDAKSSAAASRIVAGDLPVSVPNPSQASLRAARKQSVNQPQEMRNIDGLRQVFGEAEGPAALNLL